MRRVNVDRMRRYRKRGDGHYGEKCPTCRYLLRFRYVGGDDEGALERHVAQPGLEPHLLYP